MGYAILQEAIYSGTPIWGPRARKAAPHCVVWVVHTAAFHGPHGAYAGGLRATNGWRARCTDCVLCSCMSPWPTGAATGTEVVAGDLARILQG